MAFPSHPDSAQSATLEPLAGVVGQLNLVRASVGAGIVHPICGEMPTMPGLGSSPAASRVALDDQGKIVGLS